MTCQVILEFKAKKDAIEGIRSFLREILPDTRSYDGCVGLNITQNQDDPRSAPPPVAEVSSPLATNDRDAFTAIGDTGSPDRPLNLHQPTLLCLQYQADGSGVGDAVLRRPRPPGPLIKHHQTWSLMMNGRAQSARFTQDEASHASSVSVACRSDCSSPVTTGNPLWERRWMSSTVGTSASRAARPTGRLPSR